ncbi:MAG: metallophosphoesterase [Clostridia bacterium]|nr:metallophosphoesterase [Clostridia bacterium]
MNDNVMRFREDGTFHILQVSDPQDLPHARRAMLQMLDRAYDALRPDLVLFTGDNTLGNHLHDVGYIRVKTANDPDKTLRKMRRALAQILDPVERRGIPFAMIYGNHDDMNDVSKQAQFALYRAYSHCLPMNETDNSVDCDTYCIPIRTADGRTAWNLYLLDSAWNDERGQHCCIKEETVRWYARTSDSLRAQNGGNAVPSLLFVHVPLPQTKALLSPCGPDHPGAVRDGGGWACLDAEKAQGVLGESLSVCGDEYGLADEMRRRGDVRAVISGHDHLNCFDGAADGLRFIQSGAASFRCYGGRIRGVREFILRADDPAHFATQYYTYDMLCGTDFPAQLRYFLDADDKIAEKYIALGAASIAFAATALIAGRRTNRKNGKGEK